MEDICILRYKHVLYNILCNSGDNYELNGGKEKNGRKKNISDSIHFNAPLKFVALWIM